jgi:membrane-associated phospholipid phosphatase
VLTASWVISVALSLQQPAVAAAQAPATRLVGERPIAHVLTNLRQDLLAVPRPRPLATIGAGALLAGVARPTDHRLERWVQRSGESRSYTPIGGLIGNEWLQGGAAVATYAIGVVQDSPQIAHIGSDLLRAQVLNGILTTGVKLAATRTRPNGGGHSFPSGHSSATFASATVLADHYGWKVGAPAYAVAGFIGWTRIRDREHWLSDVVFGSALGIAAGHTVALGHGRSSWTVAPTVAPGGGGVWVIKN